MKSLLQKKECFMVTPYDLEQIFTTYIEEKYGYTLDITVTLDTRSLDPIQVNWKKENTEAYYSFLKAFQLDMAKFKNPKEYETGHTLLEVILETPIQKYLFSSVDTYHHEFMKNKDGHVYVFIDENKELEYEEEDVYRKQKEDILYIHNFERFSKEDFSSLESEDLEIVDFTGVLSDYILMEVKVNKEDRLTIFIDFERVPNEVVDMDQRGYYHVESSKTICDTFCQEVASVLKKKLERYNVREVKIEENTKHTTFTFTYLEGLTDQENLVFHLYAEKKLRYAEIAEQLQTNKKHVDNTLQRICSKYLNSTIPVSTQKVLEEFGLVRKKVEHEGDWV